MVYFYKLKIERLIKNRLKMGITHLKSAKYRKWCVACAQKRIMRAAQAACVKIPKNRRKKSLPIGKRLIYLVPGGGIEPPRCRQRGILSPVRLPIPPSRPIENTLLYNCEPLL